MTVTLKNDTAKLLTGFSKEDGTPLPELVDMLLEQSIVICGKRYEASRLRAEMDRLDVVLSNGEKLVQREKELNARLREQYVATSCENMALRTLLNHGTMPAMPVRN